MFKILNRNLYHSDANSDNSDRAKGFTLVELLVVMAIIAILIALIIFAITAARRASRDTARRTNAHSIKAALEEKYAKDKKYPASAGTADLSAINVLIGSSFTDPNGEDARYYYKRGTCKADQTGMYVLRVRTEVQNSDYNSPASCDTGEDFSNQ